jgi:hypothetical protein
MNCFQHTQKPAVGHCTYCGRGLCQECTTVVDGKLSCRGSCQQEIARERLIMRGSETALSQRSVIYETSAKVQHRSFALGVTLGVLMIAIGVFLLLVQAPVAAGVILVLGIAFFMHGIAIGRAGKKFKSLAAESRNEGTNS